MGHANSNAAMIWSVRSWHACTGRYARLWLDYFVDRCKRSSFIMDSKWCRNNSQSVFLVNRICLGVVFLEEVISNMT